MLPLLCVAAVYGQAPTGEIAGTIFDSSGAVLTGAAVTVRSAATDFARAGRTNHSGAFSFASLTPGEYELRAEAPSFRAVVVRVRVETGAVTTADLHLQVGGQQETVTVDALTPLLEPDRHTLDLVVSRREIEQLPLNGRSFLQLAILSPGVTVSTHNLGNFNRAFDVSILGGSADLTRITVDGAHINDAVDGGTQQNFSQEIVQEFQISSVNFDLSTGIAGAGAINIVTRTGSNTVHGSGFFFFRDHHLSAFPGLQRDPQAPDPFFARAQSGLWVGGPVRKNRLFFFAAYEHNNQRGVYSVLPSDPAFRPLAVIAPSPLYQDLANGRLDYRITDRHTAFLRYSHDNNRSFAPREVNSLPSAWVSNRNYADSGVLSVTSVLRPTLVNEFRYSMTYWTNDNTTPTGAECPGCVGLGGPHVVVESSGLIFGNQTNAPQSRLVRRHIFADNVNIQRGSHRMKTGGEWEYVKGTGTYSLYVPAEIKLFSPAQVRAQAPELAGTLPAGFTTAEEVLRLPLQSFAFGIGDSQQPPAFQRGNADHNTQTHLYWQDSWKVRAGLTLNYGLAWSFEGNLLNHDLSKPASLEPFFGKAGLGAAKRAWLRFSPMLGFAWGLPGGNTVVRAGAGIYYDTLTLESRLVERAYLGPRGTGFLPLPGSIIPNPVVGLIGAPAGAPIDYRTPTAFSGSLLNLLLPLIRTLATTQLQINPGNTDLSVRNVDVFKTATDLFMRDFVPTQAQHVSAGVQHRLGPAFAVSADFVYRHVLHEMLRGIDLNHYYASKGPLVPACTSAEMLTPGAPCTNGPVQATVSGGRSTYKGLLVRGEGRLGSRVQTQISYAWQNQDDVYGISKLFTPITNLDNWLQNVGPALPRHVLTVAATAELPARLRLSVISSFTGRMPFQPIVTGTDFYGTGVSQFLLPGSGTNRFNFGFGKSDLQRLVRDYNQDLGGRPGPVASQTFPVIALPARYDFGDSMFSQDLRLTHRIRLEPFEWQVFGEVFNLFNIANLSGFADNLLDPAFGQPTSRTSNVFGSGGPRAFQVGTRVTF
jgi:hypothetical protein